MSIGLAHCSPRRLGVMNTIPRLVQLRGQREHAVAKRGETVLGSNYRCVDASVVRWGSTDLGTDYCYEEVPLTLFRSLTRGLLGCCISCIDCLLSVQRLLIEGGAEPHAQAGDTPCLAKRSNCYTT